jgi:2-deoxy-D-gluconate 3-dehydrogenase
MSDANLFDIRGQVALVTGGRRGLGLAIAEGLARAGAKVAVAASAKDPGELSARMKSADAEWAYFTADLADRSQRQKLVAEVVKRFSRLDILVNSAGIQHRQPAMDFDLAKWDQIVSLMLTAPFELSQQAARVMQKQGSGKIINVGSLACFQGGWTIPAYAAAKHGLAGLTKALANEWAALNINVNAIAPGYFDTEMCAAIKNDPVREPKIRDRIPAGRWGQPDELVGSVLFLASEASRYIHGHVLVVDGGWMAR